MNEVAGSSYVQPGWESLPASINAGVPCGLPALSIETVYKPVPGCKLLPCQDERPRVKKRKWRLSDAQGLFEIGCSKALILTSLPLPCCWVGLWLLSLNNTSCSWLAIWISVSLWRLSRIRN